VFALWPMPRAARSEPVVRPHLTGKPQPPLTENYTNTLKMPNFAQSETAKPYIIHIWTILASPHGVDNAVASEKVNIGPSLDFRKSFS
jgi:hypothetical protein